MRVKCRRNYDSSVDATSLWSLSVPLTAVKTVKRGWCFSPFVSVTPVIINRFCNKILIRIIRLSFQPAPPGLAELSRHRCIFLRLEVGGGGIHLDKNSLSCCNIRCMSDLEGVFKYKIFSIG